MTLPTIIAELEEAERAATAGKWDWDAGLVPPDGPERYADIYAGETIIANFNDAIPEGRANARLIALMRTHLPALIEAVKRQREALNHIVSIGEAHGSNYDFERILDMRDAARAALKEPSDV